MESGMCSCNLDDLHHTEVVKYKIVKARKAHRCDECDEPIPPKTKYMRIQAFFGGSWEHMKRCIPCHTIAEDYCCGVLGKGSVWEWCWEYLGVDLKTGETYD